MRLTLCGFALLLAVTAPFASADPLQQATAAFEQGNHAEAERLFKAIAAREPKSAPAHYYLGRIAFSKEEVETAVASFEKAVSLSPRTSDYHFWLGRAYGQQAMQASLFSKGSLAKKVQHEFETAVQLDPRNTDARMGLIDFYLLAPGIMGGSDEKAQAQVDAIRRYAPMDGYNAAARIYRQNKKPDLAEQEYRAAVKAFPNELKPRFWLASFLRGSKKYDLAFAEYENAMRMEPQSKVAQYGYGRTAAESGKNLDRGIEYLRGYLGYQPKEDEPQAVNAYFWLGTAFEKKGDKASAKQNYLSAQKLAPKSKEIAEALKRVS
jgi:tetratricopeptide (TPR) repeat protein